MYNKIVQWQNIQETIHRIRRLHTLLEVRKRDQILRHHNTENADLKAPMMGLKLDQSTPLHYKDKESLNNVWQSQEIDLKQKMQILNRYNY